LTGGAKKKKEREPVRKRENATKGLGGGGRDKTGVPRKRGGPKMKKGKNVTEKGGRRGNYSLQKACKRKRKRLDHRKGGISYSRDFSWGKRKVFLLPRRGGLRGRTDGGKRVVLIWGWKGLKRLGKNGPGR